MRNLPDKPIVAVRWNDAHASSVSLIDDSNLGDSHQPQVIVTIGWLLRDDEAGVSVAAEKTDAGWRGHTFVPRGMVAEVGVIKGTRKPRAVSEDA